MQVQNVNPSIINQADLPQRRIEEEKEGKDQAAKPQTALSPLLHDLFDLPPSPDLESISSASESDREEDFDPLDEQEIFDLIATISDPEHPISLASLAVVNLPDITIKPTLPNSNSLSTVTVLITPTITHCSLATVIGLAVRVRLEQSLPPRFRIDVRIKEGTHSTADEVNKQLADKERVAAALENATLMGVIGKMLETCQ